MLVVVSGPPGSGKTRLAHAIANAVPCPAICRDEIKEGMVHAHGGSFRAEPGDPLTVRTFQVFFDVLRILLTAEVTVVAEAAFQDKNWRLGLDPMRDLARIGIVRCEVDASIARERIAQRLADEHGRVAHADEDLLTSADSESFERLSLPVPSIVVDTTEGYSPDLADIMTFVTHL